MAKEKLRFFSGTPVSEGVRLEVGRYTVFAVRNEQKDISLRLRREPRAFLRRFMRIPFLRGVVRMLRDVYRFLDGIQESSELEPQRPVQGNAVEKAIGKFLHVHPQSLATLLSLILLPVLAFLFLYAAPKGAQAMMRDYLSLSSNGLNWAVAAVRIISMLFCVAIVCRLRVFRRLMMYKGALNQAINCYEMRLPMNTQNAHECSLCTRRSESAFLLCVLVISMLIFPQLRFMSLWMTVAARIAVLLIVAALFNEPYRALEVAQQTLAVRILRAPIDLFQYMTVLPPHPQMVELAVCAMQSALGEEDSEVSEN